MRLPLALSFACVLFVAGSAGASRQAQVAGATANAYALKVAVPGHTDVVSTSVAAPRDAAGAAAAFSYPADGSIVKTGALTASATTSVGKNAAASASSEVASIALFGGEVTVTTAASKATGSTRGQSAVGNVSGASVTGLTVFGAPQPVTPNGHVGLGDWGSLTTLEQAQVRAGNAQSYRGYVTALDILLTADHGGLPAGSEIRIGYAEAWVQASTPAPAVPVAPGEPTAKSKQQAKTARAKKPPEPNRGQKTLAPSLRLIPIGLQPKLTAGGYVFPVYGPSSFTDTFGAFRGDVPGNWHHGDDLFAPLGAPILACADGTVFSVGWNDVGGNRLWLRDGEGNEFYYAHLSAYTPAARNGKHVRAGEVIGFVGNTGDAQGTPYHLHFEVHPVAYLSLGYDGAVDPTPYLDAWRRQKDIGIADIAGYLRGVAGSAPKPGAILLQASDISAANGLDPASLRRVLRARVGSLEARGAPVD